MDPQIRPLTGGYRVAGPAVTCLNQPGDNLMLLAALELCRPGDVLVVGNLAPVAVGMVGEIIASMLQARGVAGVVLDSGVRDVRELRLIGPSGPRLGRVQVRVGHSRWYTVDLSGKAVRQRTYLVRDQFAPRQSGAVTVRVLSVPRGGSVQLDALVARG